MPDVRQTEAQLIAASPDNTSGLITPQVMRDFIVSTDVDHSSRWKGSWSPSATYYVNDVVQYGNTTYAALSQHSGQQPPNSTYWSNFGSNNVIFNVKDYGASGSSNQYTGSITAATNTLTLSGSHDFQPGHGIVVRGAGASHTIPAPVTPVVSNAGTVGAVTHTYRLVALTGDGGWSAVGTAGSTTTGNATLGTTNYNNVCWTMIHSGASGGINLATTPGANVGGFVIYGRTSGSDYPIAVINSATQNCRAVYLSATGYIAAVQTDIGKSLTAQTGYNGTLVGYDNTNRIWWILCNDFSADLFSLTGKTLTISGGTGSGTNVAAPISGAGCDWAYYWSDMGDTAEYAKQTKAWRSAHEHTEGDWIFHPFNNTGNWYKTYKCRLTHFSGSTAPTVTNTLNWSSFPTADGDVYWRREDPMYPGATAPTVAVPNALITTVSSVSGNTLTLAANAGNTVSNQTVYHDDVAAVQSANTAMLAASSDASLFFPGGTYQFILGTPTNDTRWGGNNYLFSIQQTGQSGGWTLDNSATVRVMALATNGYMTDNAIGTQSGSTWAIFTFGLISSWHMRGLSNTARISWEPYGTAFHEDYSTVNQQTGNNSFYLRNDTTFGGQNNFNENMIWENLAIDGFTKVSIATGNGKEGTQGELWKNCILDYGGALHDDCIYAQSGTRFDNVKFIMRRKVGSRAVYGATWIQGATPITTWQTVSPYNITVGNTSIGGVTIAPGQKVFLRSNQNMFSATMPGGLFETQIYYAGNVNTSNSTLQLFTNKSDAVAGTNPIALSGTPTNGNVYIVGTPTYGYTFNRCLFDRSGSQGRYAVRIRADGTQFSECTFLNVDPPTTDDGASEIGVVNCYFYKSGLTVGTPGSVIVGNVFVDSQINAGGLNQIIDSNAWYATGDTTFPNAVNNGLNNIIWAVLTGSDFTFSNNRIEGGQGQGIAVNSTGGTALIENIRISTNTRPILIVSGSTGNIRFSNVVCDTVSSAITPDIHFNGVATVSIDIDNCRFNSTGQGPNFDATNSQGVTRITNTQIAGTLVCAGAGPYLIRGTTLSNASGSTLSGTNITLEDCVITTAPASVTGVVRSSNNLIASALDYNTATQANLSTYTPNAGIYHTHDITLQGSVTIAAPTNGTKGDTIEIWLRQDATGGRAASFNAAYKVGSYTQNTTASKMDALMFRYDSTNWNLIGLAQGL